MPKTKPIKAKSPKPKQKPTTKPRQKPSPRPDDIRGSFFSLGMQYYVAGRSAVFAHANPVCANLLHHAVEMFLKGGLADLGLGELRGIGHHLPRLWTRFKKERGGSAVGRFDKIVKGLHKFEGIRYPDKVLASGMQSHIELHAPAPPAPTQNVFPPQKEVPLYQMVLSDIDELVKVIFDKVSLNPRFFTNSLNHDARTCLEREPKSLL